ncbi:dTDP-4-dehydrorhamnose reductase [Marinobacterium rhizophilum]|uniref:dTDP-4-dehydrorhamnose reductase n=1 Tax=Marinobacterium rhizophilum TaxID=420402 RepID=A0ABY5HCR0_9GAMM|nr:dTDP-4-dehydrorhamnose reductase [Marinobacterium rhizophilum]UTW09998.1 dTDP-4-dehydrorhamnose reductase [Marinobacterium rhizophilum]
MKILLLGKNGQVGWELQRALAPLGELVALDRKGLNGLCGDLADFDGLRASIRQVKPDVIVNAAAYTAVDRAEQEAELAYLINADAVQLLAEEARRLEATLVHYSTDYVFDGSGSSPWRETNTPAPLNVYGASKLAGEAAILASGCRHLIFRTSWVYGKHGHNFIKTILRLAREHEQLSLIDDQVGAPTGADLLADMTAQALRRMQETPDLGGLYHLAAEGETSWYGYGCYLVDQARSLGLELAVREIVPIPATEYPSPAIRPLNSRLDTQRLQQHFNLRLPTWQNGVSRLLKEITGSNR